MLQDYDLMGWFPFFLSKYDFTYYFIIFITKKITQCRIQSSDLFTWQLLVS